MFEDLARFRVVVVTGPQRSGTQICARMIARDTGFAYVDESEVGFIRSCFFNVTALREMVELGYQMIIQAPGACHQAHIVGQDENVAVVLVRRPIDEIVASQERIGWRCEAAELAYYGLERGRIAEVKYYWWDRSQRERIANPFEVEYHGLSEHPLWLPKEQRMEFGPKQWEVRDAGVGVLSDV